MIKTGDSNRRLGIILMVLAVLVGGITATGYADQLSGPAVVVTLGVAESQSGFTVTFSNAKCRGKDVSNTFSGEIVTLPNGLTLAQITEPRLLEGLRIQWPVPVSSECPLQNLIVKAVNHKSFVPPGSAIMADVVLLFVLP